MPSSPRGGAPLRPIRRGRPLVRPTVAERAAPWVDRNAAAGEPVPRGADARNGAPGALRRARGPAPHPPVATGRAGPSIRRRGGRGGHCPSVLRERYRLTPRAWFPLPGRRSARRGSIYFVPGRPPESSRVGGLLWGAVTRMLPPPPRHPRIAQEVYPAPRLRRPGRSHSNPLSRETIPETPASAPGRGPPEHRSRPGGFAGRLGQVLSSREHCPRDGRRGWSAVRSCGID